MKRIGLTGGISTGKSTVLNHWQREAGPALAKIDTDEIAHRALEPNTPTYAAVVQEFGDSILNQDRTVIRVLGGLVFGDESKRTALNGIVHPWVREQWSAESNRFAAQTGVDLVVVCIPLLYEVGAETEFDCVVAVGCSETTQLARLATRGFTESEARQRIAAQLSLSMKVERADFVIWNDGSMRVLTDQANIILARIKETSYAPSKN